MYAIRLIVWIYNVISLPVFLVINFPFSDWIRVRSSRSRQVSHSKWVASAGTVSDPFQGFQTAAQFFETLGKKHGKRRCLGSRQVLQIEAPEAGKAAAMAKRKLADDYSWMSYEDVDRKMTNIMRGLSCHGIKAGDKVLLALETRAEWTMTAMSVIRMGSTLCTIYSTSGIDGIIHVVNETSCTHVVTNQKICQTILNVANQMASLKEVIVVEDQLVSMDVVSKDGIEVVTLGQVEKDGKIAAFDSESNGEKKGYNINGNTHVINRNGYSNGFTNSSSNGVLPSNSFSQHDVQSAADCDPDDLALLMYTSGTTGVPKGVMFSQKGLLEAFKVIHSLYNATSGYRIKLTPNMSDLTTACHFAYLPSAHIFEFCLEMFMISLGARIGYGSPLTAFKSSPCLSQGSKADAESLNPTFTIAVPLVCERIKASICGEVSKKSPQLQQLFHFGIGYKNFWNSWGFSTPLTDKILFDKTRRVFGNNLQTMVVGGAAVSESTHQFLRAALSTTVVQGYGTTETFALATLQSYLASNSDSGHLHSHVEMKLEDWEDGGYRSSDSPNPRGELVVGGQHISLGYYKKKAETDESFYADESRPGFRWFRTGDIVEVDKVTGTINIIDRKKDLVKLLNGEFVALGQLESVFKSCPFVSNLMIYGSSSHANTIIIAVPEEVAMSRLVQELKMDPKLLQDLPALCTNEQIIDIVTQNVNDIGTRFRLSKAEKPRKVLLVPDQWTAENGLTTASLKIRRKQLVDKYAQLIQHTYQSLK